MISSSADPLFFNITFILNIFSESGIKVSNNLHPDQA